MEGTHKSDLAIQSSAPTHHSFFKRFANLRSCLERGDMELLVDDNVEMWVQLAF